MKKYLNYRVLGCNQSMNFYDEDMSFEDNVNEIDRAWLAGFFDAEGSFTVIAKEVNCKVTLSSLGEVIAA